jgi:hypothetical protein
MSNVLHDNQGFAPYALPEIINQDQMTRVTVGGRLDWRRTGLRRSIGVEPSSQKPRIRSEGFACDAACRKATLQRICHHVCEIAEYRIADRRSTCCGFGGPTAVVASIVILRNNNYSSQGCPTWIGIFITPGIRDCFDAGALGKTFPADSR